VSTAQETGPAEKVSLRVLVVDDNTDAADSLSMLLAAWGHRPRISYTGTYALKVAEEFQPDCMILDIGMPDLDGYRIAAQVRANPRLAAAKLIAVTGYADEAHRRRAREVGIDHFLVKPEHMQVLESLLSSLPTRAAV
jgi:CheY-like chemotaxis protein